MKRLLLALWLCLIAAAAVAQSGGPAPSPSPQMTVATTPTALTYMGTMSLTANTSTAMTAANVTMNGATLLPFAFAKLFVLNTGSNLAYACWLGGTASASSGCEPLAAGASDTKFLNNTLTAPTFFSPSGTTLAFSN